MSTAAARPSKEQQQQQQRKRRAEPPQPPTQAKQPRLMGPHEAIAAELQATRDVLVASVISSTQIRRRVALATAHLAAPPADRPRLVLLHARPAQVCKMLTVVEFCKRLVAREGGTWYQYNQLFDLPPGPGQAGVVEETVLDRDAEESDSDDFEVMSSRFEQAVLPPPPARTVKSMRVFLSSQPVPELQAKADVTVQSSDESKA